jgi:hypothetical protein
LKKAPIERRLAYLDIRLNLDDDLGCRQSEPQVVARRFKNGDAIAENRGA